MEEMEFLVEPEAGCLREMVDAPAIGPIRLRHVVAEINRYLAKRVLVDLAEEAGERVLQPRLLELQVEVDLGALPADRVERSAESREGKECVRPCRSRGSEEH